MRSHHRWRASRASNPNFPPSCRPVTGPARSAGNRADNHPTRGSNRSEPIAFAQMPRQQYRRQPHRAAARANTQPIDPTVLRKTAVRPLHRSQARPMRAAASGLTRKREARVHSAPDRVSNEVITTEVPIALGLAPRNAHRGDDRALENLILIRTAGCTGSADTPRHDRKCVAEIELGIDHRALPLTNIPFAMSETAPPRLSNFAGGALVDFRPSAISNR